MLPPLPTHTNPDGKSLYNPPGPKSPFYNSFSPPIDPSNNGFDFHIYYHADDPSEFQFAKDLHEKIRREFPEFRIYKVWDKPVGPHSRAMFEVNTFDVHQTGTLFCWLVANRGPCPVLVHPNTGDAVTDHTKLAAWIGTPLPLDVEFLKHH